MPLPDDSQRKTRVYLRDKKEQQQPYDERIGFTQPLAPRHRALDGISAAQVIAGAAAAATSMLLASKIGIAGSVIGAAVSSAVTIICSQLYRHALEKSAEKLKLSQLGVSGGSERTPAADAYHSDGASTGYRRTRIAPAALQIRAAEERRSTQRKVFVVSIALAVAAVAFTTGAILLGTAGQGLGARPAPLLPAVSAQQQPTDNTSAPNDATADKPATEGNDTQQSSTESGADNSASDGDTDTGNNGKTDNDSGESAGSNPSQGADTGTGGTVPNAESGNETSGGENKPDGEAGNANAFTN